LESEPSETTFEGLIDFTNHSSTYEGHDRDSKGKEDVTTSLTVDGYLFVNDLGAEDEEFDDTSAGKPWTRLTVGTTDSFLGDLGDVTALLRNLERAGEGEQVGTDEVRGVPTDHYRFELQARELPKQVTAMGLVHSEDATVDVWADAEHRLRRYSESSQESSDRYEIEFFDFGAPVTIEAPPADQVSVEESPRLTGDWKLAQRGRDGDVEWQVFLASSDSGACLAHEADPPGPFDAVEHDEQRGRTVDTCAYDEESEELEGFEDFAGDGLETTATELANGKVLLYGSVSTETEGLVLQFAGGRTERLVPENRTFAIVLSADEVVDEIEPIAPDQEVHCSLEGFGGYNCSGTIGPQDAPFSIPPIPPPPPPG
jgi:hypothetical protein